MAKASAVPHSRDSVYGARQTGLNAQVVVELHSERGGVPREQVRGSRRSLIESPTGGIDHLCRRIDTPLSQITRASPREIDLDPRIAQFGVACADGPFRNVR